MHQAWHHSVNYTRILCVSKLTKSDGKRRQTGYFAPPPFPNLSTLVNIGRWLWRESYERLMLSFLFLFYLNVQ